MVHQDEPHSRQIIIEELSGEGAALLVFLAGITCATQRYSPDFDQAVLEQSPILGPYLLRGMRSTSDVDLFAIRLNLLPASTTLNAMSGPVQELLGHISAPIAIACAAGGCKALVELLKTWVEDRKGRRIKIKIGDAEIEIQGGIDHAQIEQISELLVKRFSTPRIAKP